MVEAQIVAIGIAMVLAGVALGWLSWAMTGQMRARLHSPPRRLASAVYFALGSLACGAGFTVLLQIVTAQ